MLACRGGGSAGTTSAERNWIRALCHRVREGVDAFGRDLVADFLDLIVRALMRIPSATPGGGKNACASRALSGAEWFEEKMNLLRVSSGSGWPGMVTWMTGSGEQSAEIREN